MKTLLICTFIAFITLISCNDHSPTNSTRIEADRGSVVITKVIYEKHEYLIFRGSDYFSAVVHSENCPCTK